MTTADITQDPIALDSLPGRGQRLSYQGRTYVIDESTLSVRDRQPDNTPWVRLAEGNGALMFSLHAVEIDEPDASDTDGSSS